MSEASPTENPATPADTRPSLAMRAQYIKDLSFENPRAPASLFSLREAPQMDVSVSLAAQPLEDAVFEVIIHLSVRAVSEKTTIFLSDLVYGGIFEARHIPPEQLEQTIYVHGAQLLFPFARRVIADVTRDGGFPPLQLDPIDFNGMYLAQKAKGQQPGAAPEATAPSA